MIYAIFTHFRWVKEGRDKQFKQLVEKATNLKETLQFRQYLIDEDLTENIEIVTKTLRTFDYNVLHIKSFKEFQIKPIAYNKDVKVRVTWLVAQYMNKNKFKLTRNSQQIWSLLPKARNTYSESKITIDKLYANIAKKVPKHSIHMLREAGDWILNRYNKNQLNLLPQINVSPSLIELNAGIYNFTDSSFKSYYHRKQNCLDIGIIPKD